MEGDDQRAPVSQLRPRTWRVLEVAVEDGVARGWNRAHKHVDSPDESSIRQAIAECVLGEISDWFHVDNET